METQKYTVLCVRKTTCDALKFVSVLSHESIGQQIDRLARRELACIEKSQGNNVNRSHVIRFWCYEVTKCAPEQAFADLGQAFSNYWRMKEDQAQPKLKHPRKDGEAAGFPHFKSKKRDRLSFYLANDKFSVDGHTLRVPKLGDVNMTEEVRFHGKIMSATISYRAGWWFVSIAVEVEHETPTHRGGTVGIDLGVKILATLSDGEKFENQKHYRKSLGRIQGLSRKGEDSQNRWKHTKKLARAHYRVACQRQDALNKMSAHVARTYALIGLEDLNTKGMLANHHLAQAVSDASFFEVKRQLLYQV